MLAPAAGKAARAGFPMIEFSQADVMNLPFADNSFDIASISFGIRNVADPVRALAELRRVVKPGGAVMVLEFGQPTVPGVGGLYRFYSNKVLPKIGGLITGKPQAYEYLQNSSANFPCRDGFLKLVDQAGGYATREYKPVSMGIAYIYKAIKA
jgi:demethylmenaquinone methyltransferase / 2-methoxy-6-polyprenyl-1,4-benzoquinol methylase